MEYWRKRGENNKMKRYSLIYPLLRHQQVYSNLHNSITFQRVNGLDISAFKCNDGNDYSPVNGSASEVIDNRIH